MLLSISVRAALRSFVELISALQEGKGRQGKASDPNLGELTAQQAGERRGSGRNPYLGMRKRPRIERLVCLILNICENPEEVGFNASEPNARIIWKNTPPISYQIYLSSLPT